MKLTALALAAACAVLASAAPAEAQMQEIVRIQLDSAVSLMRNNGFTQQGGFHNGALNNGTEESISLTLDAGATYAIIGVCDGDCSDMDLLLNDPRGIPAGLDNAVDDHPIIITETTAAGTYELKVQMPGCSVNPCGYGVAVFRQG
jgi:hypothetical protein